VVSDVFKIKKRSRNEIRDLFFILNSPKEMSLKGNSSEGMSPEEMSKN
jgi:hypothetical protein